MSTLRQSVSSDAPDSGRDLYDRALAASHREALATMLAAVATMIYFWAAIWLLKDSAVTLLALPIWFVASCVGGYLFSVIAVFVLVKRCFADIDLDEAAAAYRADAVGEDRR